MAADRALPISPAEVAALFVELEKMPALLLAVSGGPDSTALIWLAARWRAGLKRGPKLVAVTVDHALRAEAAEEARSVARLARKLGIPHRTVRWTGKKPATGLQEAARAARYRLLAGAARKAGASAVLTAHTLDDQAETVLIRLARGSGLTGLAGMRNARPLHDWHDHMSLVRPLLGIPKSRLIATLRAENIPYAEDASNLDPRFTRARLRKLMPALAEEGLDARRLALFAQRLARAEATLAIAADMAYEISASRSQRGIEFDTAKTLNGVPDEIAIRLLGRAISEVGDEGRVELGKLEALHSALLHALRGRERLRRSLAGALVTLDGMSLAIERAPPRRSRTLTKGRARPRRGRKKQ
jgi:tRNA(Ile)-lysidine synthase